MEGINIIIKRLMNILSQQNICDMEYILDDITYPGSKALLYVMSSDTSIIKNNKVILHDVNPKRLLEAIEYLHFGDVLI